MRCASRGLESTPTWSKPGGLEAGDDVAGSLAAVVIEEGDGGALDLHGNRGARVPHAQDEGVKEDEHEDGVAGELQQFLVVHHAQATPPTTPGTRRGHVFVLLWKRR